MGYPLLDLTNKTAVVIGGTSGIGLALTKALAQAGANVVPTSRRSEQVRSAVVEGRWHKYAMSQMRAPSRSSWMQFVRNSGACKSS